MSRISRDEMFMQIAHITAMRGTCGRGKVGAVIVKDNRVISMGYNGVPSGMKHCKHEYQSHSSVMAIDDNGCKEAVHAEANAIVFAARAGISIEGSTIYCTHSPCITCADLIINAGIKALKYTHPYRDSEGINRIARSILVEKI